MASFSAERQSALVYVSVSDLRLLSGELEDDEQFDYLDDHRRVFAPSLNHLSYSVPLPFDSHQKASHASIRAPPAS